MDLLFSRNYLIIVLSESIRVKRSTDWLSESQLANYTIASSRNLTYYITASLDSSEVGNDTRFTVGDGRTVGGYENRKLLEGETYSLYQAATVVLEVSHNINP